MRIPGSKSLSNRALLIAGLAEGNSTLTGLLESDDTHVMARAMQQLGARIEGDWTQSAAVRGVAGRPRVPLGPIDVQASGTAARFLTAALALVPGEAVLDGTARMRQRPIFDLVTALGTLGVEIVVEGQNGCPPVRAQGGRPFGGDVEVDASRSSQYISALLLVQRRMPRARRHAASQRRRTGIEAVRRCHFENHADVRRRGALRRQP